MEQYSPEDAIVMSPFSDAHDLGSAITGCREVCLLYGFVLRIGSRESVCGYGYVLEVWSLPEGLTS